MKFNLVLVALTLSLLSACANAVPISCLGSASLSARNTSGASWNDGEFNYQIFDISIANIGRCDMDSLVIQFSISENSSITEVWNMIALGWHGQWTINATSLNVNNGATLPVGISYPASVGFILQFPNDTDSANISMNLLSTQCHGCGSFPSSTSGNPSASPTVPTTPSPVSGQQSGCAAIAISIAELSAHWDDGSYKYLVYAIEVNNTGSCPMDSIEIFLELSENASISSIWNMREVGELNFTIGTTTLNISSGHWLASGAMSTEAGFILQYPIDSDYHASVRATVLAAVCASSCDGSLSTGNIASSTTSVSSNLSNPSSPPSSPPSGPSSAPSSAPVNPSGCQATAAVGLDPTTPAWVDDQGQTLAIYRVFVTNTGSCPISALTLSFSPLNLITSWNLQSVLGGYALQGFGSALSAEQIFSGSGFVLADVASSIDVLSIAPSCLSC